jgi:hypothetical protein
MRRNPVTILALATTAVTLVLTTAAARTHSPEPAKKPTITVYKDPNCGCCKNWIEYLVKHGYRVDAKDSPDMAAIKRTLGVPNALGACHTAVVNGYLIEGHVPAADIDRLLERRPRVAGLSVPGMPMGSPGMEGPRSQPYQVYTFDKSGKTTVFARH